MEEERRQVSGKLRNMENRSVTRINGYIYTYIYIYIYTVEWLIYFSVSFIFPDFIILVLSHQYLLFGILKLKIYIKWEN